MFGQMISPIETALLAVMDGIYQVIPNYGWAIIILTLFVRVILLPLTIKQTRSMKMMQALQPEIKKLQEKYKGDKEKLQQETMKFYQNNKFNPLGGCLPILAQIPIFIALYRMLLHNSALKGADFLWLSNLSIKDPLYILAILTAASTYLSQKMVTTDPQSERLMMPMTVFMGFIAINLPAGVLLYWVTTNIWTIGQQSIMLRGGQPAVVSTAATKAEKTIDKPADTEQQPVKKSSAKKKKGKKR